MQHNPSSFPTLRSGQVRGALLKTLKATSEPIIESETIRRALNMMPAPKPEPWIAHTALSGFIQSGFVQRLPGDSRFLQPLLEDKPAEPRPADEPARPEPMEPRV
jgi:hypothetical protein